MHLWSIAATVLLIAESACQASAHSLSSTVVDISNLYHLGHRRIDRQIRENTGPILNHEFYHVRPIPTIAGTPPSTTPSVATPAGFSDIEPPILNHGLYRTGAGRESSTRSRALVTRQTRFMDASQEDPTTWNNATDKACMNALSAMHGNASNPAGMAVCYNIPFLNTSTGVFQADMRLYRVAGPVKEWAAIQDQTVSIRLFYPSATVSPRKLTIGRRADYSQFWRPEATAVATELNILRKEGNTPQMLQAFGLIGQIKGDLLAQATDQ